MQAAETRPQRVTISISSEIKERVIQRKRGHQTYYDVLGQMLDLLDVGDEGTAHGVVFLSEVPLGKDNEIKKLKNTNSYSIAPRPEKRAY